MLTTNLTLSSGQTLATTQTTNATPDALLIHGWTCRRSDWFHTMEALQNQHVLAALDLPGHGDSAASPTPAWTIAALANLVAEAVKALSTGPLTLVGHSMGGVVALEAARKLPKVQSVILVDTFVLPYGDLTDEQAKDIENPFYEDFPTAIDGLVENFTAADISPAEKRRLKTDMASTDPKRMLPLWSNLLRWDPEPAFADLQIPIHAINGDLIPEAARNRCEGRVTEWHLEGAGHFPQAEMPERFHACLDTLLKQLR